MSEKQKINFIFWGTPDVASETLEILKQAGFIPVLIVTSPDKPQGRKMIITPPPVKVWAQQNNIPLIQPETLYEDEFKNNSDLFIVVAYGKIIPEKILQMPRLGSINIHYALLPKYRGASPVESAILNGESVTGVTIQQMEFKMDAGAILAQEKVTILADEKAPELRKRLIKIGAELLIKIMPGIVEGVMEATTQNENEATYCSKIKKEDGLIDLNGDAVTNYNKFRAYASWPRTFFFKDGKRIIITDAALEDDPLDPTRGKKFVIKKVIPEGGKEIDYR